MESVGCFAKNPSLVIPISNEELAELEFVYKLVPLLAQRMYSRVITEYLKKVTYCNYIYKYLSYSVLK